MFDLPLIVLVYNERARCGECSVGEDGKRLGNTCYNQKHHRFDRLRLLTHNSFLFTGTDIDL